MEYLFDSLVLTQVFYTEAPSEGPSWWESTWHTIRTVVLLFVLGAGVMSWALKPTDFGYPRLIRATQVLGGALAFLAFCALVPIAFGTC